MGRMTYVDGPKTIPDKPYDFRIKSSKIPRTGGWEIETGDWTAKNVVGLIQL